jgi:hypothetical protein
VDRAEVLQDETEVRSFTHSDDVVDLASVVDPPDDGVEADVTHGTVRGVHQAAQVFPPVPSASHRHTIMITKEEAWIAGWYWPARCAGCAPPLA